MKAILKFRILKSIILSKITLINIHDEFEEAGMKILSIYEGIEKISLSLNERNKY